MNQIPNDVLSAAKRAAYSSETDGEGESAITSFVGVRVVARAILAERERCRAIANERAAQLYAALGLPGTDEAKAGWAGQMIEALMIEQRIASGHQPKDSINIEGLHAVAKENGFPA